MTFRNRVLASSPRSFGRRRSGAPSLSAAGPRSASADELRLFALTFAGGFLFMSIYLG